MIKLKWLFHCSLVVIAPMFHLRIIHGHKHIKTARRVRVSLLEPVTLAPDIKGTGTLTPIYIQVWWIVNLWSQVLVKQWVIHCGLPYVHWHNYLNPIVQLISLSLNILDIKSTTFYKWIITYRCRCVAIGSSVYVYWPLTKLSSGELYRHVFNIVNTY